MQRTLASLPSSTTAGSCHPVRPLFAHKVGNNLTKWPIFHSLSVKFVSLLYFVNLWLAVSWTPSLTGSAGLLWKKSEEEAVPEFHGRGQRAQFRLLASTPLSSPAQQTAVDRHHNHIHHKAKTGPRPARSSGQDRETKMQFGQENFWGVLCASLCAFSAHLGLDI